MTDIDPAAIAARIDAERKTLRALSEIRCQHCRKWSLIAGVYVVDGEAWLWMPAHEPFRQAKDGAKRWPGDVERALKSRDIPAVAIRVVAPANLAPECPECQRPTRLRLDMPGVLTVQA